MNGAISIFAILVIATALYALTTIVPADYRDAVMFVSGWLAKGTDTAIGNWLERR